METCPCCLRTASPGLFEKTPEPAFPEAILSSNKKERKSFLGSSFSGRHVWGRFFLKAKMPLPLRRENTPINLDTWIEVQQDAAEGLKAVLDGQRRSFSGRAILATDAPGFPGSAGATCRIRFRSDSVQILDCFDKRITDMPADLDHNQMAALYRRVWGNEEEVAPVRWDIRKTVLSSLEDSLDRRHHIYPVQPPPRLAGMDPGEVVIAPPLDTGQPALLSTLGCSDVPDGEGIYYEILTSLQNPSEDLVRCFGEFAYLSRMNPEVSLLGQVVPERKPIPDSEGNMSAWLLVPPDTNWPQGAKGSIDVRYLWAIPIMPVEMSFATAFGPERLSEVLNASGEDLTSLQRGPSVEAVD